LRPTVRVSGRRRYGEEAAYRGGIIVICKRAGLQLGEIRALLSARRPKVRQATLARKRAEFEERLATIRAAQAILNEVMYCDAPDPVACPTFRAIVDARVLRGR
jgi:DNA-binding transcriptional MerR regulator